MSDTPAGPGVATIVAADAVDKLGALAAVSRAVGAPVRDAGTSRPSVPLGEGVWAQIDIPKFGEPPPLAIDVHAVAGESAAREHALRLLVSLRDTTDWTLIPAFDAGH